MPVLIPFETKVEAIKAYLSSNKGQAEIAKEFGVSHISLFRWSKNEEIVAAARAAMKAAPKKFTPKPKMPEPEPEPEPEPNTIESPPEPDWQKWLEEGRERSRMLLEKAQEAAAAADAAAAAAAAPSPPPSSQPSPEPASFAAMRPSWGYKGFGCDFAKTARFLINRIYPTTNTPMWMYLRLMLQVGAELEVISPYHSKDGTDYYYSISITHDGTIYTAHLYGPLIGSRFDLTRAVLYYKRDSYEMTFVKRNPV